MIRKRFLREPLILSDSEAAGLSGKEGHPQPRPGPQCGGRKDQLAIGTILFLLFVSIKNFSWHYVHLFLIRRNRRRRAKRKKRRKVTWNFSKRSSKCKPIHTNCSPYCVFSSQTLFPHPASLQFQDPEGTRRKAQIERFPHKEGCQWPRGPHPRHRQTG